MKFIDTIAHHIFEKDYPLDRLTIVLPSLRSKKYFANALTNAYNRPILAPEMLTMDQWIKAHSPLTVIDKTRALIELFKIQLEEAKTEEDKSFDEFLSWGTTLLADFNEIDRYLLDAKQVFRNLADIKEIEQWSFGEEELTESQKRFMEFWDRLPGYYHALNERLEKMGSCYAGKSFKFLAHEINRLFIKHSDQRFIFAGFNALSKAELSIIRQLEQMGRAEIFIDADVYYYNNKAHEAGRFLRDLSQTLDGKKLAVVQDTLSAKKLDVELIECAQNTGQVKVAASILSATSPEDLNDTLLLLADETLIGAIIKNLPKSIGKANITLGLPIRNTSLRTWVDLVFSIQENKLRFKTNSIYFHDLQKFWNHPFVLAILPEEEKIMLLAEERKIIGQNRIFINSASLSIGNRTKELLELLITPWERDWVKAITTVRQMNRIVYNGLTRYFAFEKAVVECFDGALVDFENIIQEGIPTMQLKSFKQLFHQHWSGNSIAYHGNPTEGLQIMGLLETRALDFKHIICVGMNEGELPPTNPIQTMIPMDLRRFLGLPTPREKQGLFAHHFYRLLHHAETLKVTYNSADESIGSNEPSRYLLQLEIELSRMNPNVSITKRIYTLNEVPGSKLKEIPKTPEILQRIDTLLAASTSASMLKKYLTCPLDFYFRYVMDFGEEDAIEEEIENSTFGTFIHNTLEELYLPFARYDEEGNERSTHRNITSVDIEQMLKKYKLVLHQQFMNHFNNDEEAFTKGKNLLPYQMAMELTERFLKSEVKFISEQTELVYIEALEREYTAAIDVEVYGEKKTVNLRGFVDRIDRVGDTIRIIDYKSGKVATDDVQLRAGDTDATSIVESLAKRKHLLQLIQYAYLYKHQHGVLPQSSIISFISGNNTPFALDTKKMELEEVVDNYPVYLGLILESLYNIDQPFEHEADPFFSYCQYCE